MAEPVLATHGLTKRFGALLASDAVSLDLRPGEIHAVIGPNGAGKSTLLAQICGTLAPDAGRMEIAGRDVTGLGAPARARAGLGRTFQVSELALEHSVLENAVLGAIGRTGMAFSMGRRALGDGNLRARAEEALDRVGLLDRAAVPAAELSHGQRRLLEVALALTLRPRAFVMDEPMAGLGADGSGRMTRFLDGLRAEAPILLVEHDMDAVFALSDRVSVLVAGRIVATGSPDAIRADPEVRAAYLGEDA